MKAGRSTPCIADSMSQESREAMTQLHHADPEPDPDLHAFVDDELSDEDRFRLEHTISNDSDRLSELRAIVRAKNLVAGLPRFAASPELSTTLVKAIRRRRLRLWSATILSVGSLAAASILFLFLRMSVVPLSEPTATVVPTTDSDSVVGANNRTLPTPSPESIALQPALHTPQLASRDEAPAPARAKAPDSDRERLRRLLDRGATRQVTVAVEDLSPATLEALDSTIRNGNYREPEHARLSRVSSPSPVGVEDIVYALVMDEVELGHLRRRIERVHPRSTSVDEVLSDEVRASVASVGDIQFRKGTPRASLMEQPSSAAFESALRRRSENVSKDRFQGTGVASPFNDQVTVSGPPTLDKPRLALPQAGKTDPPLAVYLIRICRKPQK